MSVKVSVVVCTYNREKYLGTCLKKLALQTAAPTEYEVIVVNNNSTDATEELVLSFIKENPLFNFRYYNESSQGHSFSRNRGIRESGGEIITFIDDDAFVYQDFVKNIELFFFHHPDVAAIGGKILPVFETEMPGWMSRYLMPLVSALDMGDKAKPFRGRKFPVGANMSFRKEVFQKFGVFNTDLGRKGGGLEGGDEKEVFLRLKKQGEKIMYAPQVCVDHIIPEKRVEEAYIRGLGVGVGTSERKRIKGAGLVETSKKAVEEFIKVAGTVVLFLTYSARGRFSAAWMLVKFRLWVIKGLVFGR